MFNVSVMGMFVYKKVTSYDTIISSSSMGNFLLLDVAEFLTLSFSYLTQAFRMFEYHGEPLYETIGRISTPGLCILH